MDINKNEQMDAISELLDVAYDYELEVETVYCALMYMKENPTATPLEAFQMGITEWIK